MRLVALALLIQSALLTAAMLDRRPSFVMKCPLKVSAPTLWVA